MIEKVNFGNSFAYISDYWSPKIAGELNRQHVKLAKLKGEFVWHKHDQEDELFLVISGELIIELRDKKLVLKEGEMVIILKGVEHKPVAENEVDILLFEPISTLNTGEVSSDLRKENLDWI
jgi:mannose-6-phosphate isomerase-like protein (cupin superfamily)|tara:strand:+ start:1092 stop:1454 length:363 start_codon:yes stop_codon:yes gene_type:complete